MFLRAGVQFARGVMVRNPSMMMARWPAQQQLRTLSAKTVKITFVDADGDKETVDAKVGSNMLNVCHDNDIEVEGACGGEMACSTCHMIFDQKTYDALPEKEEEEEDMLDLALGLTETSRLGCQVIVTEEMEGITVRLPAETSNQLS